MIHTLSEVQTDKIGEGTQIWQFSIVLKGARIGKNCNINCYVFIENDVIIGDMVTIKPCVQIWDGTRIEDSVFIGPNVTFTNDLTPRSKRYPGKFEQTIVRKGASVGANSTILAGKVIGEYAMIGAGSVITKDVPPHTLWVGNPGKHSGYVTKDGEILDINLISKVNKQQYTLINHEPVLKK